MVFFHLTIFVHINMSYIQVRHKLDNVFAQPKAVCYFELVSPVAYESPRTVAALKLFEFSLDERLNEYTYDAEVSCAIFLFSISNEMLML